MEEKTIQKIEAVMTLSKVNIVGSKYFHRFTMGDGSITEVETTREDYEQLGTPNPVNPTIEGGVWLNSYSRDKYDTVDGDLSDRQYVTVEDKHISRIGDNIVILDKDELVDSKISQTLVNISLGRVGIKVTLNEII